MKANRSGPRTGSSPCPSRYAIRLSIAVIAMSNLPAIRLVSWNTELGVGVSLTSMPCFANRPFSCATQIGQLKPPGKTITFTVLGGAGGCAAQPASTTNTSAFRMFFMELPPVGTASWRRDDDDRSGLRIDLQRRAVGNRSRHVLIEAGEQRDAGQRRPLGEDRVHGIEDQGRRGQAA